MKSAASPSLEHICAWDLPAQLSREEWDFLRQWVWSAREALSRERPFQHLRRQALEDFYMGALETIGDLEQRLPATEVMNEPGTSWEIVDGVLSVKAAS